MIRWMWLVMGGGGIFVGFCRGSRIRPVLLGSRVNAVLLWSVQLGKCWLGSKMEVVGLEIGADRRSGAVGWGGSRGRVMFGILD